MKGKPQSVDDYLSRVPPKHRAALQKLRKQIRAIAPTAVEYITYQLPAFKLNGKALVAFGDAKDHCSLYPMSSRTISMFDKELADFSTSRGTIRFTPERPIPASLIRKIVKARMAQIAAK